MDKGLREHPHPVIDLAVQFAPRAHEGVELLAPVTLPVRGTKLFDMHSAQISEVDKGERRAAAEPNCDATIVVNLLNNAAQTFQVVAVAYLNQDV